MSDARPDAQNQDAAGQEILLDAAGRHRGPVDDHEGAPHGRHRRQDQTEA
jgi:hypothetical protein